VKAVTPHYESLEGKYQERVISRRETQQQVSTKDKGVNAKKFRGGYLLFTVGGGQQHGVSEANN